MTVWIQIIPGGPLCPHLSDRLRHAALFPGDCCHLLLHYVFFFWGPGAGTQVLIYWTNALPLSHMLSSCLNYHLL